MKTQKSSSGTSKDSNRFSKPFNTLYPWERKELEAEYNELDDNGAPYTKTFEIWYNYKHKKLNQE